jgi:hypothetical protein
MKRKRYWRCADATITKALHLCRVTWSRGSEIRHGDFFGNKQGEQPLLNDAPCSQRTSESQSPCPAQSSGLKPRHELSRSPDASPHPSPVPHHGVSALGGASVLLPCTIRGAQKKSQSRSRSQDDRGTTRRYTFLIMLAKDIPVLVLQSPRHLSGSAAQAVHHPVLKLFMNTLGYLALLLSLPRPISNYHCSVSTRV